MKKTAASRRFYAYLLAGVLALAGAAPALAQAPDAPPTTAETIHNLTAVGWANLGIQLTLSLDSPVEQIRQETLQHINFFATHYGDRVDFARAVPRLLRIYETDATEGYRIMALTALHAIGDAGAMQYLREALRWERSERVRRLTLAALADYAARTQAL